MAVVFMQNGKSFPWYNRTIQRKCQRNKITLFDYDIIQGAPVTCSHPLKVISTRFHRSSLSHILTCLYLR